MPAAVLAAVVLAVLAAGFAASAQPDHGPAPPLLGVIVDSSPLTQRPALLVRLDRDRLVPTPERRIAVGSGGCAPRSGGVACFGAPAWSFSPDRERLVFARHRGRRLLSLRLVDVTRMRRAADIRIAGGQPVGAVAWISPRTVLALQEAGGERQRLLAVDLARRRAVARRGLKGSVLRLARTSRELVMLIARPNSIGPATLAVAGPGGDVRFARLGRIVAGSKLLGSGRRHRVRQRLPGMAVDEEGRRAFVVAEDTIAEIDLATVTASYHRLGGAVAAKAGDSRTRVATWLGGGLLAVSGSNDGPAGLRIVDTRDWSVRTLEAGASDFLRAGDLVLATGRAIGVVAFGLDGNRRFQLFEGEEASVYEVHGGRAFVRVFQPDGRLRPLRIVDLATGRVVAERRRPLPQLLTGSGLSWWGR